MPHFSGCLASTVCRKGEMLLAIVTNSQQFFLLIACQNHRRGTWGTTSNRSSSNFEVMMENARLRASLPVWVEALWRTCCGCQWKESVWVTGRIAQDIQGPCDACSKSSYISMFHLSNVPLSSCPSSQQSLACNLKSLLQEKDGKMKNRVVL